MVAVAEDGMARLRRTIELRLDACRSTDPFARLLTIADAYVLWAVDHPTHYRVVGDRVLVDFYGSQALQDDNRWIRETMLALFNQARDAGTLRSNDVVSVGLQTRAVAYGLARMYVDDHLREFGIGADLARASMIRVLRDFIISLTNSPDRLRVELEASGSLG